MKRLGLLFFAFTTVLPAQPKAGPSNAAARFESLVREWIAVEKSRSDEARQFKEDTARLETERELLQHENVLLDEKIAEVQSGVQGKEKLQAKRDLLQLEIDSLSRVLAPHLAAAEKNLLEWKQRLPPGLKEGIRQTFEPLTAADVEEQTADQRLQNILVAQAVLEDLANRISRTRAVLIISGQERQVDLLYLGLTQGYAVTPDTSLGGMGTWTATGWEWEWNSEWGNAVQRAMEVYEGVRPAALESLPVKRP